MRCSAWSISVQFSHALRSTHPPSRRMTQARSSAWISIRSCLRGLLLTARSTVRLRAFCESLKGVRFIRFVSWCTGAGLFLHTPCNGQCESKTRSRLFVFYTSYRSWSLLFGLQGLVVVPPALASTRFAGRVIARQAVCFVCRGVILAPRPLVIKLTEGFACFAVAACFHPFLILT